MTVLKAAKLTHYSKSILYDEIAKGKLKATVTYGLHNKKYDVSEEDLKEWVKKHEADNR